MVSGLDVAHLIVAEGDPFAFAFAVSPEIGDDDAIAVTDQHGGDGEHGGSVGLVAMQQDDGGPVLRWKIPCRQSHAIACGQRDVGQVGEAGFIQERCRALLFGAPADRVMNHDVGKQVSHQRQADASQQNDLRHCKERELVPFLHRDQNRFQVPPFRRVQPPRTK